MVGRLAMNSPWEVSKFDKEFFGVEHDSLNREEIILVSL
jgi:hypothetical protein